MLWPRTYVHPVIEPGADVVRFALGEDSPMFAETDDFTWLASLAADDADRAVRSLAQGFDRRATVTRVEPRVGERCAYELRVPVGATPEREAAEVSLIRISTGAGFELGQRRPVRV